eukprot:9023531-Pyramimonas_sp.AAC.1
MAVANLVHKQPNHTELIANFSIDAIRAAQQTVISENNPDFGASERENPALYGGWVVRNLTPRRLDPQGP